MKYLDASALLRVVFGEPGERVPLAKGDVALASALIEVEAFRAVDRLRLMGQLDDLEVARKRKDLTDVLGMMDLVAIDDAVLTKARSPFGVNVRALDALHVATAELLTELAGGEALEFWTHDERQALAAMSRGLTVKGVALPGAPS